MNDNNYNNPDVDNKDNQQYTNSNGQQQTPPNYNQPNYNQANFNQQNFNQPPFGQGPIVPPGYTPKSKIAAGLLGIFLGWIGVHNFYLGFTGKAVAQLILGIFSCGTISGIWGLIEGIIILSSNYYVDKTIIEY
ncbi:MAG: TM2 domain-containing protein [Oscillospiraceae bacterium]